MHCHLPLLVLSLASQPLLAQSAWSMLYPTVSPSARGSAVMACHEATGAMILLGGQSPTGAAIADGWRQQGDDWVQLTAPLPPARSDSQMVYDSVRQRLVMFGGIDAVGALQDTWQWDGLTWTSPLLLVKPPARWGHAMAFDPERGVTVLYGGYGATPGNMFDDLWEWDGSTWQQIAASNAPGPRLMTAMAFDPVNHNVLLHGGIVPVGASSSMPANDTWSWNGSTWQQHQPATPPTLRNGAALVCDTARQRVVLTGGSSGGSFAWEWDGLQWSLPWQPAPSERNAHAVAYDGTLRRVVLFGGRWLGSDTMLADTWQYETAMPANIQAYGSGCTGTAGTPELGSAANSLPWLGDTVRNVVSNVVPGALGALFVSSFTQTPPISLAVVGMPGCDLLLTRDFVEFRLAVAGSAEWTLQLPSVPEIAGVPLYQQAFPFDAAATSLGLTASNGLIITPGIR